MTAAAAAPASQAEEFNPDPGALLDAVTKHLNLKNDAALARALEFAPPVISKIRHSKLPVGAMALIRMHEVSGIEIKDLRALMGDRRKHFRGQASE
ncbi:hypothetical protein [Herbaspirillum sp. SJZ107]|uniref:hypothetical protein n=1 Tax=Herbaspirillum sp. SJZ107 TaxID=2572881 RepID=UPI00114F9FD6|nr:hypothetical protein [Herbaspirillum sp. SJZ107]TQK10210.1 hypothetical protein FBX97_0126 [Herbaspirillum sp. SJZ107]